LAFKFIVVTRRARYSFRASSSPEHLRSLGRQEQRVGEHQERLRHAPVGDSTVPQAIMQFFGCGDPGCGEELVRVVGDGGLDDGAEGARGFTGEDEGEGGEVGKGEMVRMGGSGKGQREKGLEQRFCGSTCLRDTNR